VASVNNGERAGVGWGSGGGWNDGTTDVFPDSVEITFSGAQPINEIDVFTLQDNFTSPSPPTETMTFTQYGITAFDVQYWDGVQWLTVPGGSITGNNLVWRKITFGTITTTKIRILVNNALASYSRITEIEAYTPSGFTAVPVAGGISSPTAMDFAPDGRLFVCQQTGQLRVISGGSLLPTPFVNLTVNSSGERGLLGVTFDPDFANNHFVYVYYTATTPTIHNRVSRFTANGDVALGGSEVAILDLNDLSSATNHNGGAIHFGPDGKLYIAVGENANPSNSQTLNNLLGKMLRINADGTIPPDNPFFSTATGNNRAIWALGLRNPFTFGFQPGTGRMFINDVGQNIWEEINDGIVGSNYGWSICEGACGNPSFRDPLFQYGHGTGPTTGCAITGAAFYNPPVVTYPADYVGKYFFADLCSGWIRRFDPGTASAQGFTTGISSPVDLHVGPDGNLYYLAQGGGGMVVKILYSS
jgi:glucose/arabinose dehydrogenase